MGRILKLEELVRSWAVENKGLLIVTGPVLREGFKTIGVNRVSVPELYYKVILDNREPVIKGIAFLIPHATQRAGLQTFVVSIDSVESITGIDFFPHFQNEDQLEKTSCLEQWTWTSSSPAIVQQVTNGPAPSLAQGNNHPSGLKASVSVQCRGMTKAGNRCKNKTMARGGYCHLHESQAKGEKL